jgi:signal transduction histidine kinase/DNA-binding response OmpR family regulator
MSRGVSPFGGRSEMHARINEFDWAATSVGPIACWPQSLRATVKTLLGSRYPMILLWGPELLQIYNEAYIRLIGDKHPGALGRSIRDTQAESWEIIGPMIHEVMSTAIPNWVPAQRLPLERSGYREESYFSLSYSAVEDDTGQVAGMLCVCSEVTQQVLGERRLELLRALAFKAGETRSVSSTCRDLADVIAEHPLDVPFSLLYLREEDGDTFVLQDAARAQAMLPSFPSRLHVSEVEPRWAPLLRVLDRETIEEQPLGSSSGLVGGPWSERVTSALVLPLKSSVASPAFGLLIAGKSPNRALDEGYRSFYELLGGQVALAICNARAYEGERQRAEALAALDSAKMAFFSNISHEFRTPLTLILGPVRDALAGTQKSLTGADLEAVNRSALRLLRLVNSLLDFSRIEAGRLQSNFEPTDLSRLTAELASSFRPLMQRGGLELMVDCPPLSRPVVVDRGQWEQIVVNLLSNAFKFTFQGTVSISLCERGDNAELTVADTGTGISPDQLPLIFERFHRVMGARGRSIEGTGIGLSLVAALARQHRGDVRAESVQGKGSRFIVTIPLRQEAQARPPSDREGDPEDLEQKAPSSYVLEANQWLATRAEWLLPESGGSDPAALDSAVESVSNVRSRAGRARRVLIADDNADLRQYLLRLLGKHFEVELAEDGLAALDRARRHPPDLVLSDVMLPGLDGFALLRALRQEAATSAVPVILLSARAGEEAVLEGLTTGADDYLVKPFSARELLARVRTQLEMAQMRRAVVEATERERHQAVLRYLADASAALAESLDYRVTLREVAQLSVPILADWCWIQIESGGSGQQRLLIVQAHPDAQSAVDAARESNARGREGFPAKRLLEGPSVLIESLEDHLPMESGTESDAIPWFRALGIGSLISVPLRARGRALGSLTLGRTAASGRRYDQAWLGVAQDVARRCAMAVDNAGLYEEAQRAIIVRDEFLSIASHELRTPLTPLQLQIHILTRKASDVARDAGAATWLTGKLEVLRRQSARLDRLVTELLDVERIAGQRLTLQPEWMGLEEVTREVLRQFEETGELARSGCRVDIQVSEAVSGYWDRQRVEQVLTNLLENALKFGRGKPVDLRIGVHRNVAMVTITDQGLGIAPEDQERIFERFERAVPERHYGGLGLGLWIVSRILEAMGGKIDVESVPGKGARFRIELPLTEQTVRPSLPGPFAGTTNPKSLS